MLMKQKLGRGMILMLLFLSFTPIVYAAGTGTIALEPTIKSVKAGELFDLAIRVSPNGESLDTVRVNLRFPADLLQVDHFTLGEQFPRISPGVTVDNSAGTISEGGFNIDHLVSTSGIFGTVTFMAVKEGAATIAVGDSSHLIANGDEKLAGTNLASAAITIANAAQTTDALTVLSSTHPNEDAWYSTKDIGFTWNVTDGITIRTFYSAFDQQPNTNPTVAVAANTQTFSKTVDADGVWYFHLKGQKPDGTFTEPVHFKVQIDTVVPNVLAPTLDTDQISTKGSTTLRFGTTDELSGVDHYEVSLNQGSYSVAESPYLLQKLEPNTYLVSVKAVDRAGNAIFGASTLRVYPPELFPGSAQSAAEGADRKLLIITVLVVAAVLAIIMWLKKRLKK